MLLCYYLRMHFPVRELVAQVTVIGNATELELLNNENETSIFRGS